jgi:hypothetical protein
MNFGYDNVEAKASLQTHNFKNILSYLEKFTIFNCHVCSISSKTFDLPNSSQYNMLCTASHTYAGLKI